MPARSSSSPPLNPTPREPSGRWRGSDTVLLLLLLLPVLLASVRAHLAQPVLLTYGIVSLLTALAYGEDKRRARLGKSRIPEWVLHLAEALGGWPGAFVVRQLFRHKTQKRSYRLIYWLIVASHLYVALDYLLDWRLRRAVLQAVRDLAG